MIGYVFIAFLLVFTDIYFTAYHLQSMYPKLSYTLQSVLIAFLILVPVLTMRMLAEERRQKTDQMLLTAPVSVWSIVFGKYAALVCVFVVPVLVLCIYPMILSQFGSITFPETYCAILGFFLLGAAYLAVGLFISALTESQVIAAVLTFFILFVSYVIKGIASFFPETAGGSYFALAVLAAAGAFLIWHMLGKAWIAGVSGVVLEGILCALYFLKSAAYEGLIQKILNVLNAAGYFDEFADGMLDVTGIIYYLSLIALFLFLTVQAIQKRRWGTDRGSVKNGSYSMAVTAVVTAGVVAVNLIAGELPSGYTQVDMTDQKLSVLSEQSKEIVRSLDRDVTVYYILQDSSRDENISRLLEHYDELSSHLTVEEVDPVRSPRFAQQYTSGDVSENSVIVTCEDASRVIDYNDMYEYEFDYTYYSYDTTGFDAEGQITSAIAAVSSDDLPKVYTLTGHGELQMDTVLSSAVEKENITLESLNLIGADTVPEDAAALVIISPSSDLTQAEADKIMAYLMLGGCVLIITDYTDTQMPNLLSVMECYGIQREDGVVMESDPQSYIQVPYYLLPSIGNSEMTDEMTDGSAYVIMASAQGLAAAEDVREEIALTEVLTTSSGSYLKTDVENMHTYAKESGDIDGPFAVGMTASEEITLTNEVREAATKMAAGSADLSDMFAGSLEINADDTGEAVYFEEEVSTEGEEILTEGAEDPTETVTEGIQEGEDGETQEDSETATAKLAVFTSSSLVDSSMSQMVSGGNQKLFTNTVSWMVGHERSASIPVKSISVSYLMITAASSSFWSIVVIGVIPGAFLAYGFYVWLKRRKK